MSLKLGDTFPNREVDTTFGKFKLHDYFGDSWGLFFSHPADYTPVCTTEHVRAVQMAPQFTQRDVKMVGLAIDSVASHLGWADDIMSCGGVTQMPYPIIADQDRSLAIELGMLDPDTKDEAGFPLTCRAVFFIGPDKKIKASMLYPATAGKNYDELLRVIDSVQLTAKYSVATPADWTPGADCMIPPGVSSAEADQLFPAGYTSKAMPSGRDYMRLVADPSTQQAA